MVAALSVTLGLFIRVLVLRFKDFNRIDAFVLLAAMASIVIVFAALSEHDAQSRNQASIVIPFMVAGIFAFTNLPALLRQVTELLMLLYGLVASVLVFDYFLALTRWPNLFEFGAAVFLVGYLVASFVLVATKRLPQSLGRYGGHVASFLMVNVIIGGLLTWSALQHEQSLWGYIVLGYVSLSFLAHLHYVVALILVPGRHESFWDRLAEVEAFTHTLHNVYVEHDAHFMFTAFVIVLVCAMTALAIMLPMNIFEAMTLALLLGNYVVTMKVPTT